MDVLELDDLVDLGAADTAQMTVFINGKAPKILTFSDSVDNRLTEKFEDEILKSWGFDPVWVGSMQTSTVDGSPSNATGPWGECRESRGLGGLVNCTTACTTSTPLSDANVAAYVAGNKAVRLGYNPGLRPKAIDGSEDAIARNGQVFDLKGAWLDRLSPYIATVVMPDIVRINLLTNDWTDDDEATMVANINFAVPRVLDSVFAAKSTMKVLFGVPGTAEDGTFETNAGTTVYVSDYRKKRQVMLKTLLAAVNGYSVPVGGFVAVTPYWAQMSPHDDWQLDAAVSVDPATGYRFPGVTDPRHPLGTPRLQRAMAGACAIACLA